MADSIDAPMGKYTPGPWTVRSELDYDDDGVVIVIESADMTRVAHVLCESEPTTVEQADARLIGAAPDLLEQAKDTYLANVFACCHEKLCGRCRYCKLRALIERLDPEWLAKAEGRAGG
jgi:hypothetical protein